MNSDQKRSPIKYCEWVRHAYDFQHDQKIVTFTESNNTVSIVAHPAYPNVELDLAADIVEQVYLLPKSLQLYFFGLVWAGFLDIENSYEKEIAKKILYSLFDYAERNPDFHEEEMIWDDHALSERACVLLNLKEVIDETALILRVESHLELLNANLEKVLSSEKWTGNNHRIFHLCAKYCLEKYFYKCSYFLYLNKIEDFFLRLIDIETGLAVEQAVSYYNFDIALLGMVEKFVKASGDGFKDTNLRFEEALNKKNSHMAALAFPDGSLPASGDTSLGLLRNPADLDRVAREKAWKSLERVGHYRGRSDNDVFHYHVLTHNAESAHGHRSPLHVDLWIQKVGMIMVDSGGPYKYGDPLRHQWFTAYEAHNTINFEQPETEEEVVFAKNDFSNFCGLYFSGKSCLKRKIKAAGDFLSIEDTVTANESWSLHFNFDKSFS